VEPVIDPGIPETIFMIRRAVGASGLKPSGRAGRDEQPPTPARRGCLVHTARLAAAQNFPIWTAYVIIGLEPADFRYGGTMRILLSFPITQRYALDRRNLEAVLRPVRSD
jgi:hypothetical protein